MMVAVIISSLPVLGGPEGWRERVSDPPTFLVTLTLVGVAILLWSYREPETGQR
jgi:hypothetical protein